MNANDVLDTAPCGFVSFGDDGSITLINTTLLGMLGFEREELVGQHIEKILAVGTRIFYQTHWFPLLRMHGQADEIFLLLRGRAGENVGVLANAVRREREGRAGYDCILLRVRERQKYEDELLRARRVAEDARAELEIQKRDLEIANERLHAQSVALERKQRELEDRARELRAASEELKLVNEKLFARSVEAEELREAAESANQAKSKFLAVMSHELRTPLNAIGGYAQILEMGIPGPVTPGQLEALDRIARSQAHLLTLINDILNLAQIEAGRVEYAMEDLRLTEVVAAVAPMVEPQMEAKRLVFEVSVPNGVTVRADREKARQVILNLLGNAVKFTGDGGRVSIEAIAPSADEPRVSVRIRDTGIGIPTDKLASIFEPFVQIENGKAMTTEKGSGLGLSISRDLARGMGGDLIAESEPGVGSAFILLLPHGDQGHADESVES